MDHPSQRVSSHSCHEQPSNGFSDMRRVTACRPFANIPLGLRVAFACLLDVAAALVICVLGCPCGTVFDIKEGFSHLIEKMLGWVLLWLAQMVICR
jgi:hypothetical protein